jgi:hypothetical protein
VLLGDPLGVLRSPTLLGFGFEGPLAVRTVLSGTGKRDLVVTSLVHNALALAPGLGDGTFGTPQTFDVSGGPGPFAVGDFNGDGIQDVAVAKVEAGTIGVLLHNSDGGFEAVGEFAVPGALLAVSAGDLNGDGRADLAVLSVNADGRGEASVWLGNGDGTFSHKSVVLARQASAALVLADLNGDGKLDLVVANYEPGGVSVALGLGDGTFQEAMTFAAGSGSLALAVGDFDRDGHPDLAVANYPIKGLGASNIALLLGNGDGTFQAPRLFGQGLGPLSLTVADFNGDGRPDLAVSNQLLNNVAVLLGSSNSDAIFEEAAYFGASAQPGEIIVADFDGDGQPDLAVADVVAGTVAVLRNTTDELRTPANGLPLAQCQDVTVPADHNRCTAAAVSIDDGSFDTDGDPLTVRQEPPGPYGLGETLVTLTVTDVHGAFDTCTGLVTVGDQAPPDLSRLTASPAVLSPPNHQMVAVTVRGVTDACDATPRCALSVSSNEPVEGTGDGDRAPDWQVTGPLSVNLRAERAGTGYGRLYTLALTCADAAGNTAVGTTTVTVPHNQ